MNKLLSYWNKVQDFLDVRGDVILLFMSSAVIYRLVKNLPLSPSDAAAYATAVGALAATKIKTQ